ncbi:MAG TPA: TraR/DksA family transcriptional regulator [Candidatus Hydrogenedentes bacterium]|nr:TraR/DksA family transcriptional regulator [Candidatus Hydrogenedentota bacterium]HNT88838.1 TraR/DksA family transcriptional regulator [Candidatus Hydrogenedentota bacterium]
MPASRPKKKPAQSRKTVTTPKKPKKLAVSPKSAKSAAKARPASRPTAGMTKKELQKFEKLLLAERERILHGLNTLKGEVLYQPLTDRSTSDPNAAADVGTDSFDRETALQVVGTEARELYEIDQALQRIQDGAYGICEGTGNPIPKKRLEVFPAARYCVEYQAELEKSGRADNTFQPSYTYTYSSSPTDFEG